MADAIGRAAGTSTAAAGARPDAGGRGGGVLAGALPQIVYFVSGIVVPSVVFSSLMFKQQLQSITSGPLFSGHRGPSDRSTE